MTDEATMDSSIVQQPAIAPLGEVLLAARNAKKLTQKDVSNSLRLSTNQINALETNEFSALPDAMITRGFIRNYARLLEVDAEPLLASYRLRVPGKSPSALSVQSSTGQVMSGKESQPWLKYILGSIVVLLFLLAWFFYMDYMPKPAKPSAEKVPETVVTITSPTAIPLPEIALPAAERQADGDAAAIGADAATTNTSAVNTVPAAASNAMPPNPVPIKSTKENASVTSSGGQLPATTAAPAVPAQVSQLPVGQDGKAVMKVDATVKAETKVNDTAVATKKVSLSFSEETWVSVKDKSGKVVFEKVSAAGSTDGFDGMLPFTVVIGNAKATKVMFLGKQIDLAPATKNNVAHLTLE